MPHYRLHRDPRSSHQQIAQLVRRLGQGPLLDVGAAQGILGQLLYDWDEGVILDAVEPNRDWAGRARPFYRQVFATTIEEAPLRDDTYRTIVCADILEHTVDPAAVLRRLRRAATADALFIISLPNVAHLAVRLLLLAGRFPRMERGILDRTHLHYYTRDTAEALARCAGLDVLQVRPTGAPLDELWPGGIGSPAFKALSWLQRVVVSLAPRLFAFQWIFLARPVATGPHSPILPRLAALPGTPSRDRRRGRGR